MVFHSSSFMSIQNPLLMLPIRSHRANDLEMKFKVIRDYKGGKSVKFRSGRGRYSENNTEVERSGMEFV
jgi:hypothetical protein